MKIIEIFIYVMVVKIKLCYGLPPPNNILQSLQCNASSILINGNKLVDSEIIYNNTEIKNLKNIQTIYTNVLNDTNIKPKEILNIYKSILLELEKAHKL